MLFLAELGLRQPKSILIPDQDASISAFKELGSDYPIIVDERRRLMELSSEDSGDRGTITKTDRELKAKAAQLVEEFDGDGRYLPLLRTDLVATSDQLRRSGPTIRSAISASV